MRRGFTLFLGLALVAIACAPQDVTEETSTTSTTVAETTTAETTATTSPDVGSSTIPQSAITAWTETRSAVPDNVALGELLVGAPGFVLLGWHDKIPGVQGVRSGLWFSDDGASWAEVTPAGQDLEWVEFKAGVWTGTGYMVVAEGIANAEDTGDHLEGVGPLLFRSENGRDWSFEVVDAALVAAAPSLGRLYMTPELIQYPGNAGFTDIIVGSDGLLVTGWMNTSDGTEAVMWSSSDGEEWTVRVLPGAKPNVRADGIERGSFGYVVIGSQQVRGGGGGITSVLWRSNEGRGWELVNQPSTEHPGVEPLIPDLWYLRDVAVGPSGYLVSGSLWSDTGAIEWHLWHSKQGNGWAETDPFPGEGTYVQDVEGNEHGYVAVGCQTIDHEPVASLWRSADGRSWKLEPVTFPSACLGKIQRFGNRWVVTGENVHPDSAFKPSEFWRPTEFIIWTAPITTETRSVVLVPSDEVLNVRSGPGVDNDIITSLSPTATGVILTGRKTMVGSSVWVEIVTEQGTGWVNECYLAQPET
jgi:hypothetical protein